MAGDVLHVSEQQVLAVRRALTWIFDGHVFKRPWLEGCEGDRSWLGFNCAVSPEDPRRVGAAVILKASPHNGPGVHTGFDVEIDLSVDAFDHQHGRRVVVEPYTLLLCGRRLVDGTFAPQPLADQGNSRWTATLTGSVRTWDDLDGAFLQLQANYCAEHLHCVGCGASMEPQSPPLWPDRAPNGAVAPLCQAACRALWQQSNYTPVLPNHLPSD